MSLSPDLSLKDVAALMGMSERWVRARVAKGAEHQRYGHVIKFTEAQVEKLRAEHTKAPATQSITTGRKRSA